MSRLDCVVTSCLYSFCIQSTFVQGLFLIFVVGIKVFNV